MTGAVGVGFGTDLTEAEAEAEAGADFGDADGVDLGTTVGFVAGFVTGFCGRVVVGFTTIRVDLGTSLTGLDAIGNYNILANINRVGLEFQTTCW